MEGKGLNPPLMAVERRGQPSFWHVVQTHRLIIAARGQPFFVRAESGGGDVAEFAVRQGQHFIRRSVVALQSSAGGHVPALYLTAEWAGAAAAEQQLAVRMKSHAHHGGLMTAQALLQLSGNSLPQTDS